MNAMDEAMVGVKDTANKLRDWGNPEYADQLERECAEKYDEFAELNASVDAHLHRRRWWQKLLRG